MRAETPPDRIAAATAATVERRLRQAEAVVELGRAAFALDGLPALVRRVADTVAAVTGADLCLVALAADGGRPPQREAPAGGTHELTVAGAAGVGADALVGIRLPAGPGTPLGAALAAGGPVLSSGGTVFASDGPLAEAGRGGGACAVVHAGDEACGALAVLAASPDRFEPDDIGFLDAVASVLGDAVARRRADERLRRQALHDSLTGLPNRALFLDRLRQAFRHADRRPGAPALLFIDLDDFKLVNDSLGHDRGDDLLRAIVARVTPVLRTGDTLCRLGGDEFVVLCDDVTGEAEARRLADRIVALFTTPLRVGGADLFVTTSIGVAVAHPGHRRPEDLLRDADAAMYRAKQGGRNRVEVYHEAMHTNAGERLDLRTDLRAALDGDQLEIDYQPIVELESGRIVALEALMRWRHPSRGVIDAADFLPIAEQSGLIVPIGTRVLRRACAEAARWRAAAGEQADGATVAVNVSFQQLADPDFVYLVTQALESSRLPAGALCLELTESAVIRSFESTVETLQILNRLGVRFALDSFGSGMSSLQHLRRLPLVDFVKLDRCFIQGLGGSAEERAVIAAITSLAGALALTTVAHGVERADQAAALSALGCRLGQGNHLGPPVPADAVVGLLRAGPRARVAV